MQVTAAAVVTAGQTRRTLCQSRTDRWMDGRTDSEMNATSRRLAQKWYSVRDTNTFGARCRKESFAKVEICLIRPRHKLTRESLSLCRFLKIVFAKCPCPKLEFARIGIKKSWRFEKTPPQQIKKTQIHFWMSWHFQTLSFPNLKYPNLTKGVYFLLCT